MKFRLVIAQIVLPIILLLPAANALSSNAKNNTSPAGYWLTIDDKTNQPRAIIKIYPKNDNTLAGKTVAALYIKGQAWEKNCTGCIAPWTDQSLNGLEFMYDFKKTPPSTRWIGKIFDPESKNKIYNSKMWLEDSQTLKVRGYILFFYRTQEWKRLDQKSLQQYLAKAKKDRKLYPQKNNP